MGMCIFAIAAQILKDLMSALHDMHKVQNKFHLWISRVYFLDGSSNFAYVL